ncbi:13820_t:CDS:2, partial [Racocetra persica]
MGHTITKPSKGVITETSNKCDEETYLKSLSVLEAYRFIQGRKSCLAPNVSLALPRDNEEAIRFNKSIRLKKIIFGSNYSAPVSELLTCGGAKVLEIGTGGGLWLTYMSNEYPTSIFLGLDVTTIFNPDQLPENSAYLEHNYHDGIPFPNDIYGSPTEIIGAGPATQKFILSACTIPEKLRSMNFKNIQIVEKPLPLSRNKINDQIEDELLLRTVEAFRVIMKVAIGCTDEEYDKLKRDITLEAETLE